MICSAQAVMTTPSEREPPASNAAKAEVSLASCVKSHTLSAAATSGQPVNKLSWFQHANGTGAGVVGQYYSFKQGANLPTLGRPIGHSPVFARVDSGINFGSNGAFDWPRVTLAHAGFVCAAGSSACENFYVRWQGYLRLGDGKPGQYMLGLSSDDGSRAQVLTYSPL